MTAKTTRVGMVAAMLGMLCAPACIIHSETVTRKEAGERTVKTRAAAPARPYVRADVTERGLSVGVWMWQECIDTHQQTMREIKSKRADMDAVNLGGGGGGKGALLVIAVAVPIMVVTGAVSGLITAVDLAVSDDKVSERTVDLGQTRRDCSSPVANARLRLVVPGRSPVVAATDNGGQAMVPLSPAPRYGRSATLIVDRMGLRGASMRVHLQPHAGRWTILRPPGGF